MLPNYQDTSIYTVPDHDRSPVTIGWAGSHTHRNDLNILTGTIGRLIEQHPDTRLLTIGGYKPAEDALGNGFSEKKEHLPWCEQMVYFTHLPKIDIGLCPIVPNKFNDSKVMEQGSRIRLGRCTIDLLEYGTVSLVHQAGLRVPLQ